MFGRYDGLKGTKELDNEAGRFSFANSLDQLRRVVIPVIVTSIGLGGRDAGLFSRKH